MTYVFVNGRTYRISDHGAIHGAYERRGDPRTFWRFVSRYGPVAERVRAEAGRLYPKPIGPVFAPWQQEFTA